MSRPRKCRRVCGLPANNAFYPARGEYLEQDAVILTVEEYETLRLIDHENFSQEECGEYMQVARTSVQLMYNNARKKLAHALVNGLPFRIEGGHYILCSEGGHRRGRRGCHRRNHAAMLQESEDEQ